MRVHKFMFIVGFRNSSKTTTVLTFNLCFYSFQTSKMPITKFLLLIKNVALKQETQQAKVAIFVLSGRAANHQNKLLPITKFFGAPISG